MYNILQGNNWENEHEEEFFFFGRKKFWAEKLVWKLVQDPIFGDAQSSIHNPAEVATKCAGFYQNLQYLQYLQYSKLKIYTQTSLKESTLFQN